VLFWIPLVRNLTRSLSHMTHATEQIAEGQFEARVNERRRDELGRLAQAINRMAARLAGFVTGQKRFLGDIAHELCSPLARMQVALGILEERAGPGQKAYVADVREEVEQMSGLVNELLSFSKAGLRQKELPLEAVRLETLAQEVIAREVPADCRVELAIAASLSVQAEPELLRRALANVLRNAARYAGAAGPIRVSALAKDGLVIVAIADQGPGVKEDVLPQIFDPFFRGEASRSRDSGGAGLGLAIVKSCVEACQGRVSARNLAPSGLCVEIVLRAA
jgi:two-component system sensor histidine kinase CpxA